MPRLHAKQALCVVAALALASLFLTASAAFAASDPPPTMGLSHLQQLLDNAGGNLDGYFLTVDHGSTIDTIPCTVESITSGPLIMFEATGTLIAKFGGIVEGMSGSPIYVHDTDDNTDTVVGAVSYGDYFTLGGTGLATPIDDMTAVAAKYAPKVQTLPKPVITSDGVVNSVIVAPDPQNYEGASQHGAFVAKPLASFYIGGLDPRCRAYKHIATDLASRGESVTPLAHALSGEPWTGHSSFATTFTEGTAVTALETRGDLWVGGIGTVTYADGDNILMFGHPLNDGGKTTLYMLNTWIDGVWPSTMVPYKLGEPTALRGTITRDVATGCLGRVDSFPDETTITATVVDDDSNVGTSTVFTPRDLIDQGVVESDIVEGAVSTAGYRLFDSMSMGGSADVTTTVVVSDGTDQYTIVIPNIVDDRTDVPDALSMDAGNAIDSLQSVLADGVEHPDILSVDVQARLHAKRASGHVVGVDFPNGIQVGDNPVKISTFVYGVAGTQTINATMTVPSGTPVSGSITAVGYTEGLSFGGDDDSDGPSTSGAVSGSSRQSISDIAGELNATPKNSSIIISFQPDSIMTGDPDNPIMVTPPAITTTVTADQVMDGSARITSPHVTCDPQPTLMYGDFTDITGEIDGPSTPSTLTVYATPAGGTEQLLGTTKSYLEDGDVVFDLPVDSMSTNTTFRVHFPGAPGFTPADGYVQVYVRAMASLTASAKSVKSGKKTSLRATVVPPSAAGGKVVFEYNDKGRHWKTITTQTLVSAGWRATASVGWKAPKGKHNVRFRYLGGTYNASATSNAVAVTAK